MHNKIDIYWGLYPEQRKFFDLGLDEDSSSLPESTPKFQLPLLNQHTTETMMVDLKTKINVDSMPTIAFYTFFNSYNTLNRVSISSRGDLVAAGFSDSSIKLWDLTQDDKSHWNSLTQRYITTDGRNSNWKPKKRRDEGDSYNLLSHSGPIYGLSFSPDSQFLLSCGQDTTVRLWSMATKTNLVCYRGHCSPVWDVEFGPLGYYFATAGHDKLARFWATNHITALRIFAGHLSDVNIVC
eukprot:TRINITY_DN11022_c0_g1_i8.p1 TRINITY_DN11022_c0_g1~~TRINITY_DN11022_c0_g1_i8.p1  ORF type:complete len:239 (-),score=37.98 TRINITY_DN11022_c0_g1_i8:628-1344(-)